MLSANAIAEDSLKGEGELGFTSTSGNTESQSLNAKPGLIKTHGQWTHNARISALQTSTNSITSARSTTLEDNPSTTSRKTATALANCVMKPTNSAVTIIADPLHWVLAHALLTATHTFSMPRLVQVIAAAKTRPPRTLTTKHYHPRCQL